MSSAHHQDLAPGKRIYIIAAALLVLLSTIKANIENLLLPETQALLSKEVQVVLQEAIVTGVALVFWIVWAVSLLCLGFCWRLPGDKNTRP